MRLAEWIEETAADEGDRLVVMHGMSSRVLRGMLTRRTLRQECAAPVAEGMPQGSVVEISDGTEALLERGDGGESY